MFVAAGQRFWRLFVAAAGRRFWRFVAAAGRRFWRFVCGGGRTEVLVFACAAGRTVHMFYILRKRSHRIFSVDTTTRLLKFMNHTYVIFLS